MLGVTTLNFVFHQKHGLVTLENLQKPHKQVWNFCFDPVRTLVFRKIVTHHTISGLLSCYCMSVISRFSLFYDASQPRVTFQILVKYSCLKGGDFFYFKPSQTTNVVTAVSIQVPRITSDFLLVRWPHWSNGLVVWNTIARRLPKHSLYNN